ncbi:MAG: serine/threonine protein kinase, partial [Myxococcales bacterium]|nr:serine/threonine protein kinase [Myxococcales bacterium]
MDRDELAPRLDQDTLEQQVFAARLEARMLGGAPELPRIDRFTIERKLGAGGMGTVWLAHDQSLDRRVALKLVRGKDSAAGRRMRLREARGLARISHPNVIAVYDVGEHEGRVWLAMEYVPGRTLHACAGEFDRAQILAYWIAAGRGIAAIHGAGLVHRDIKP